MIIDIERSQNFISHDEWRTLSASHDNLVRGIIEPYLQLRSHGKKHAVMDFLFEYYSFRPNKILTWNPGFGVTLSADWTPSDKLYQKDINGDWLLSPSGFAEKRLGSLDWVISLLENIRSRPMAFGCYGLHEWAMVYKSDEIRHSKIPLRLSDDEIVSFIDSQQIRCSHFDAYRFFTEPAKPLNLIEPKYNDRLINEQGGCIHANMDLYKWAYKFHPWTSSEMIAEAFLLAVETRTFDMQASPYDLSLYGLEPIRIETAEGRDQYQLIQKQIAEKARSVRSRLLNQMIRLRDWVKTGL